MLAFFLTVHISLVGFHYHSDVQLLDVSSIIFVTGLNVMNMLSSLMIILLIILNYISHDFLEKITREIGDIDQKVSEYMNYYVEWCCDVVKF